MQPPAALSSLAGFCLLAFTPFPWLPAMRGKLRFRVFWSGWAQCHIPEMKGCPTMSLIPCCTIFSQRGRFLTHVAKIRLGIWIPFVLGGSSDDSHLSKIKRFRGIFPNDKMFFPFYKRSQIKHPFPLLPQSFQMLFTSVEWFQAGDELAGFSGGFASSNIAFHTADNIEESHVGC